MSTLKQIKTWQALIIYLSVLFLTNYINSSVLHAPLKEKEFEFNRFITNNFSVNAIISIIKITTTSLILIAGTLIIGVKIKSKDVFKAVVLAYLVPTFRFVILIIWASFNWLEYSREDLFNFFTWRFTYFIEESESIYYSILDHLNLYDLIFVICLIFLLKAFSSCTFKVSRNIVLSSYVPALIIYSLFISMITTI